MAEPFSINEFIPFERDEKQLYVFSILESPAHTKHDISDELNVYNITMTYRLDSDIVWTYAYIKDVQTDKIIGPNFDTIKWKKPNFNHLNDDIKLKNLIMNKNKTIAWFVSHCNPISNRDNIAKVLNKYIPVDIYGKCGNLICPRGSPECDDLLNNDYKFYLSFENSLCKDYVTEKFFNVMIKYNIIPIVYGGADYNKFAPPYSYINIEDFHNIKELSEYLLYLLDNPNEYIKYFWWKKYYKYETNEPLKYCKLCEILNKPERHEKIEYYKDIQNWWYKNSCRLKPKIKLE